jgi:hypothetical protein
MPTINIAADRFTAGTSSASPAPWANTANAYADNTNAATGLNGSGTKNASTLGDYGFPAITTGQIPDGSTIDAVRVVVRGYLSVTNIAGGLLGIEPHNPAGTSGGSESTLTNSTTAVDLSAAFSSLPTLANLRSAGEIRARLRAAKGNSTSALTVYAEYVWLEVDYTEPVSGETVALTGSATGVATTTGNLAVGAALDRTGFDSFSRTVSNGWGTSSSGHPWDNTAAAWSVSDGRGRLTVSDSSTRNSVFGEGEIGIVDMDGSARWSLSGLPTAGNHVIRFYSRRGIDLPNPDATQIRHAVRVGTAGAIEVRHDYNATGTNVDVETAWQATGKVYTAGEQWHARWQSFGSAPTITARIRVWRVGDAEPSTWDVESTFNPGSAVLDDGGTTGFWMQASTTNTAWPLEATVDDLTAEDVSVGGPRRLVGQALGTADAAGSLGGTPPPSDPPEFVRHLGILSSTAAVSEWVYTVPSGGVAQGDTLVIASTIALANSTLPTVTVVDSRGNTYTVDHSAMFVERTFWQVGAVISAHIATALQAGDTITISHNGSGSNRHASSLNVYRNLSATARVHQVASAKVDGAAVNWTASPDSGLTAATIIADALVFGAIHTSGDSAVPNLTAGTGFTLRTRASSGASARAVHPEDRIVTSTGQYRADGTLDKAHAWQATAVVYVGDAAPSGAAVALAGSAAGAATATAVLFGRVPLAGSATAASTTTGNLTVAQTVALAGSAAGAATTSGVLQGRVPLAGTATGTATTTADLRSRVRLTATATGAATGTAAIRSRIGLTASAAGSTTTGAADLSVGYLGQTVPLVGSAASVASTTGSLRSRVQFAAVADGTSTTAGDLTVGYLGMLVDLTGSATGHATGSAAMAGGIPLLGEASGTATTSGDLRLRVRFSGAATGQATGIGQIATQGMAVLAGSAAGTSTTAGALAVRIPLGGYADGTATTAGVLWGAVPLSGGAEGAAVGSAAIRATIGLSGASQGVADAVAALGGGVPLSGSTAGAATTTATITSRIGLAGSAAGSATTAAAMAGAVPLAGTSTGISTTAGSLRARVRFSGSATGEATGVGAMAGGIPLAGTTAGAATGNAIVRVIVGLTATAAGSATTDAVLDFRLPVSLAGSAAGQATGIGSIREMVVAGQYPLSATLSAMSKPTASIVPTGGSATIEQDRRTASIEEE